MSYNLFYFFKNIPKIYVFESLTRGIIHIDIEFSFWDFKIENDINIFYVSFDMGLHVHRWQMFIN